MKGNRILSLIGAVKLVKAALLIAFGLGALELLHRDLGQMLRRFVESWRIDPHDHITEWLLSKVAGIRDRKLIVVGVGSLLYGSLFIVEGVGLLRHKRWAEYFTVVTTGLLMPLEIYELVRHPTVIRATVLILNAAVVVYLIVQLRRGRQQQQ